MGMFLGAIVAIALLLLIYFAPTIKASSVRHRDQASIFILNLFLGWALIPWVIALVWAYKKPLLTMGAPGMPETDAVVETPEEKRAGYAQAAVIVVLIVLAIALLAH